jgi:hypothetical protein
LKIFRSITSGLLPLNDASYGRRVVLMSRQIIIILFLVGLATAGFGALGHKAFEKAPHDYWTRDLKDPFTQLKGKLELGDLALDRSGELPFLKSLLNALDISPASQMLVFSTTSLQLRFITPGNPRALYFNEDVYLGYIPGGRLEIVSVDPKLGGIYYIFDIPKGDAPMQIERSNRCMNCHAAPEVGRVPGLLVQSVIPGRRGGSLESFRSEETGHGIPFSDRYGGWYVTGDDGIKDHWGNTIGEYVNGEIQRRPIKPGALFSYDRYLAKNSDILAQMIHEHQVGFVNRAVRAAYTARKIRHEANGQLGAKEAKALDVEAEKLTRYLLFADEAALPAPVRGVDAFKQAFRKNRKVSAEGISLKDLNLKTRLFEHRCSYMIYSQSFQGLPGVLKQRVYRSLGVALNPAAPKKEYAYLPDSEKRVIRAILKATLLDLPSGF